MQDFAGKIAVITGGGTGMGRELARQLVAQGCDVAMCDVSGEHMAECQALCEQDAPQGIRVTSFKCDVSHAEQMNQFATHVGDTFNTSHINLLFNNAGVAGAGSFLQDDRQLWERTFNICWGGVYNGARAFMPMLVNSTEGHIVNTSSINGFWASSGPDAAHTSYSAAKFAVKGFTEALVTDLRLHAPHVKASVVMPGHIGTSILLNSQAMVSNDVDAGGGHTLLKMMGMDVADMSKAEIDDALQGLGETFRDQAPTSAAEAATVILEGVKAETWRILVGADAHTLDTLVRGAPEDAYERDFLEQWTQARNAD